MTSLRAKSSSTGSITDYEPSRLKALLSVVHQDYARYYITLKDNIKLLYQRAG